MVLLSALHLYKLSVSEFQSETVEINTSVLHFHVITAPLLTASVV
jgi:hypothetical protein